jgi:hypothetical protein
MNVRRALIVSTVAAYTLGSPIASLAQCPSSNVNDVLNDPVVQDALDRAWRDSHEGYEDEHEEGGDILQCREANADGSYSYRTEIRPWPSGESGDIAPGDLPPAGGPCRFVATYHTHPGGAGDDGHDNHLPSPEDKLGSGDEGVPGIIRWGHDGDTHDFTYGYDMMTSPRDPSWTCPDERPAGGGGTGGGTGTGSTTGEPHMRSFDGQRFDFQAIGDFILVRSRQGSFEVHVRQQPYRRLTHVSLNSGVVVRDGRDRIEWEVVRGEPLLNGRPRAMRDGEVVKLRSHAILRREGGAFVLATAAGDRVSVALHGPYIDVRISLADQRKGSVSGLLGNYDGNAENDVQASSGALVSLPKYGDAIDYTHSLFATFGASWRVPAERNLFTSPFSSSADPAVFPARVAPPTPAVLSAAADRCASRGVTDEIARANCAYDLAVTGDDAFIASGVETPTSSPTAYAVPLVPSDAPPRPAPAPPAAGGAVAADRDVSGSLNSADQRIEYSVELRRGAYVFDARGSTGTSWTLMTPDRKSPFNTNQSAYMGQYPVRLVLTRDGPHVITVGVQPGKASGRYQFQVRSVPDVPVKTIAVGEEISGRIGAIGEEHIRRVQLAAGRYAFESLAAENTAWELTSPNGRSPFDGNQQEYMRSVPSIDLPSGRYVLKIRGRATLGVGAYRFRISRKS